ncbi:MAG: hypothetical protein JXQ87_08230 [Bacteroidia bacterium]
MSIGFCLFMINAKAIVIHPKAPFEGLEEYIDSLNQAFENGKSEQKLKAAFTLWSISNHKSLFFETAQRLNSEIDTASLSAFISSTINATNNVALVNEWALLKLRKRIDNVPSHKSKIDAEKLPDALLATHYIITAGELGLFDINGFKHLQNFRKCYAIAQKNNELKGFEYLCLRNFGMAQFHKNNIDSSVYYFKKIIPVCLKMKQWNFKYIPGYGVYHKMKQNEGRMRMNLGMSIEKTGKILEAINEYEHGESQFDSIEYYPGIWWGKSQILNSYLNLGEHKRAQKHMLELVRSIQNYFGDIDIDNEFLWIGFHEFEFYDLYENRLFLDSLFNTLEVQSIYHKFRRRLPTRNPLEYSMQQRYTTIILAIKQMLNEPIYTDKIFRVIDSLKLNYLNDPAIEYATKNYIFNSMKFNEAAWQVALDYNNKEGLKSLEYFLANQDSIYNYNGHFNTITILLQAFEKYEVLEQLIATQLKKVKKGNNVIAQSKLYYQYAKALEKLDRANEALVYYHKSDSIKQTLKTLNHFEQLNKLDRRIEIETKKKEQALLKLENATLKNRKTLSNILIGVLVLLLAFIVVLVYLNRRRVLAKRKQLIAEKELLSIGLKNEKEKFRVASLEILKSNQSISRLISNVDNLKTELSPENKRKVMGLLIDYKAKSQDEIWQQFNLQFQSHYQGFYKKLAAKFPDLTENEKRLCAMHISGLSNNEINAITGQKMTSIYTMKSKIRKKLGVDNDEMLGEMLQNLSQHKAL